MSIKILMTLIIIITVADLGISGYLASNKRLSYKISL